MLSLSGTSFAGDDEKEIDIESINTTDNLQNTQKTQAKKKTLNSIDEDDGEEELKIEIKQPVTTTGQQAPTVPLKDKGVATQVAPKKKVPAKKFEWNFADGDDEGEVKGNGKPAKKAAPAPKNVDLGDLLEEE